MTLFIGGDKARCVLVLIINILTMRAYFCKNSRVILGVCRQHISFIIKYKTNKRYVLVIVTAVFEGSFAFTHLWC